MKLLAMVISGLALVGILLAVVLVFTQAMDLAVAQRWLLGATLAWFMATPVWMERG
jgi:hypothetical protein